MSIRKILKLSAVWMITASLSASAVVIEKEAVDGAIDMCTPEEIIINEDFSRDILPDSSGTSKWSYKEGVVLSEGTMSMKKLEGKQVYSWVTPAAKLNYANTMSPDKKYVFSFDMTRNATVGFEYPLRVNHIKDMTSGVSADGTTYTINVANETTNNQSKNIASGIPVGEFCNVEIIYTIGKDSIVCDITVRNKNGDILGTLKDYTLKGITEITAFGFYTNSALDVEWKFDNIKLYPYKKVTVADPTITEEPIFGMPEAAEEKSKLIDENFDSFPEVVTDPYIGDDLSKWSFDAIAETKILTTGRKVLKLSDNAGLLAAVSPAQALLYSEEEGASNKYVQTFGMKYLKDAATKDSGILKIKNNEGKEYDIFTITPNGYLTSEGDEGIELSEKWYSAALTYEIKKDFTVIKPFITDGENVKSFKKIIIDGTNSIEEFIYSVASGGVLYLDNVSLYEAVYVPALKPEARDMTVTGVCYNGRELEGDYEYYDPNQDDRGTDEYFWVRSDNAEGGPYEKITGTDQSKKYTLTSDDIGKYVFFAVIPKKAPDCDEAIGDTTYKMADAKIAEEPAVADLNWLIEKNLGADDLSEVTEDLILSLKGENGSTIVWQSDDEDTIGTDGTVKRQSSIRNVTLTATVTGPDKVVTKEHKFEVSVKAKKTSSGGSGGGGGGGGGASNVIKGSSSVVSMPVEMLAEDTNKPMERPKHKYNDVADGHWAMDYIQELYHREIAMGDENNNFAPSRSIKREEFTKMIVSAFNLLDETAFVEFNDVDSSAWYYPYVASAYKSLLVSGVGNDKFGIGDNITRQDMAVIAYRILKSEGIAINGEATEEFADYGEVAPYAKEAVSAMQKAGIMSGSGNNEFRPTAYATRAEVARIIVALLECAGK